MAALGYCAELTRGTGGWVDFEFRERRLKRKGKGFRICGEFVLWIENLTGEKKKEEFEGREFRETEVWCAGVNSWWEQG